MGYYMNKMKKEKAMLAAQGILNEHTSAFLQSVIFEPESEMELWEAMTNECAYILTERLLKKEITLMEYNAIRNELANLLWSIYPNNKAEDKTDFVKLFSI